MTRFLACALIVFGVLTIGSAPASACSCGSGFGDFARSVGAGTSDYEPALVFSGRAVAGSKPGSDGDHVVFDVERAWGEQIVPLQVALEVDTSSCGIGIPQGLTFFMAYSTSSGGLSAGTCETSTGGDFTALFDEVFGPGKPPVLVAPASEPPAVSLAPVSEAPSGASDSLTFVWLGLPVVGALVAAALVLRRRRQRSMS